MKRSDRAGDLFNLLADAPEGISIDEIAEGLNVGQREAESVLRVLRLILGNTDDLFVVCDRDPDGVYRYRLMSGHAVVDAEESSWTGTRIGDLESRLVLFIAAARSAVAATDGRSKDGQKAHLFVRWMQRLAEDLAELEGRLFP